jgi:hypothetical protein
VCKYTPRVLPLASYSFRAQCRCAVGVSVGLSWGCGGGCRGRSSTSKTSRLCRSRSPSAYPSCFKVCPNMAVPTLIAVLALFFFFLPLHRPPVYARCILMHSSVCYVLINPIDIGVAGGTATVAPLWTPLRCRCARYFGLYPCGSKRTTHLQLPQRALVNAVVIQQVCVYGCVPVESSALAVVPPISVPGHRRPQRPAQDTCPD